MATFLQDPRVPPGALLTPSEQLALSRAPRLNPAVAAPGPAGMAPTPFWDLAGKYGDAKQIAAQELRKFAGHHNDLGDATRHAEASMRLSDAAGPVFASIAGVGHEIIDTLPPFVPGGHSQPLSEGLMDLINNAHGIDASIHHRAIDPAGLQDRPISWSAAYATARQQAQDTSPDGAGYQVAPGGYGVGSPGLPGDTRYDPQQRFPPY